MGTVDDLEVLSSSVRGLRTDFEERVEPLRPELWRYCQRLTGSAWDAEDLVQETMQRALARLADLWQPIDLKAYLFRIASNAWIDRRRSEVRAELIELSDETLPCAPSSGADLRLEAHEAMARIVTVLTPLQRVVFLLSDAFDFRGREVAALVGTTEGAVKAALHRARRALAEQAGAERSGPAGSAVEDALAPVVRRFIEAFDARDPDAIAALLHEDAVSTIVGSAVEIGRDVARRSSLAEWAAEPGRQWIVPGRLDGRDVLFVLAELDGRTGLNTLIELEHSSEWIHGLRNYFFSPDLIEHAAEALGAEAFTHGHRYSPP